jgi:hypothetical protein
VVVAVAVHHQGLFDCCDHRVVVALKIEYMMPVGFGFDRIVSGDGDDLGSGAMLDLGWEDEESSFVGRPEGT